MIQYKHKIKIILKWYVMPPKRGAQIPQKGGLNNRDLYTLCEPTGKFLKNKNFFSLSLSKSPKKGDSYFYFYDIIQT